MNWEEIGRRATDGVLDLDLRGHINGRLRQLQRQGVESIGSLGAVLDQEGPSQILADCCWLAGFVADDAITRKLVAVLQRSSDDVVIWEAAKALSVNELQEADVSRIISVLRRNKGLANRAASALVFGSVAGEDAVRVLMEVLQDTRLEVALRGQAAEALGETGSALAVDLLIDTVPTSHRKSGTGPSSHSASLEIFAREKRWRKLSMMKRYFRTEVLLPRRRVRLWLA